jgi:cardiolipin synthase
MVNPASSPTLARDSRNDYSERHLSKETVTLEPQVPTRRDPFFTLPNLLTLSRVPLGILVWLRPADPVFLLGVMALAGVTDVLDGWLERRHQRLLGRGGETPDSPRTVGVWLDPLCDKVFILSVLAAIAVTRHPPLWILPLVALREILQALIAVAARTVPALGRCLRFRFRANLLGKSATVAQFLTIGAILLSPGWQIPLAITTAALGVIAVVIYVRRAL